MSESITNVAAATNFDKDNSWKYFSTFNSIFQLDSINDFFPLLSLKEKFTALKFFNSNSIEVLGWVGPIFQTC